jgi:hypothetical protein
MGKKVKQIFVKVILFVFIIIFTTTLSSCKEGSMYKIYSNDNMDADLLNDYYNVYYYIDSYKGLQEHIEKYDFPKDDFKKYDKLYFMFSGLVLYGKAVYALEIEDIIVSNNRMFVYQKNIEEEQGPNKFTLFALEISKKQFESIEKIYTVDVYESVVESTFIDIE